MLGLSAGSLATIALLVLLMVLVDRVVCQVTEKVLKVSRLRRLVLLCAKACHTLPAQVSLWLVKVDNYDVNTQVEFESIESQRIRNVALHDHVVAHHTGDVIQIFEQEAIDALRSTLRLRNEDRILVSRLVLGKTLPILG